MKRISPVIVVGLALTVLSIMLFNLRPRFMQAVSNYAYDALLQCANQPAKSGRVAWIDIDDASIQAYGQWPWPRNVLANLTRRLWASGVSVLAFDVIFPELDRTSPLTWKENIRANFGVTIPIDALSTNEQDFDRMFSDALSEGKSILGCMFTIADSTNTLPYEDPFYRGHSALSSEAVFDEVMLASAMQATIPQLRQRSETAFINAIPDEDNIVRSSPLIMCDASKRMYHSLALEAIRLSLGVDTCRVKSDERGISEIGVGPYACKTDRKGCIVINHRTPQRRTSQSVCSSFPTYSAIELLENRIPTNALAGKIVFVGTSAAGLRDLKATPLASDFPGVEVHATIVDNILTDDVLSVPSWMMEFQVAMILLVGLFLTFAIMRSRSWLSFLLTAALVFVLFQFSLLLFRQKHVVFVPSWVILTAVIMYPILTTIKYWQEERQRKRVRTMFGTMVSEPVLKFMEKNPDSFSLSGVRAEATMFFSDIAGFASITESLQPEQLPALLNSYLSPMTKIILDRGGYLDKYEGDLIMAEWGIPFHVKDHTLQACLAALEQQEKLRELRPRLKEQFGHDIHVRMGINTGIVTAGNMGSDRRFQYTVLGDSVNLAARFEPINKDYRTSIIIGEDTARGTHDELELRLLDLIQVKGISRPVKIYELLGRRGSVPVEKLSVVSLYQQALELHWKRQWGAALKILSEAMAIDPVDGPSLNLKSRLELYMAEPPEADWQGEHVRLTKE